MFKRSILFTISAVVALAGPPLVCHRIEIGTAQSLPWSDADGWDGTDAKYDVANNLSADTLRLLDPKAPLNVRMETLRRAAIYSAKSTGMADRILAELLKRAEASEAANRVEPIAWFDAGYFAETVRQTAFLYRHDMLSASERKAWTQRGEKPSVDGLRWMEKAIRLGGTGMEPALAMVKEYRQADLRHQEANSAAK